jgi:hypothetical protein
MDKTMIGDVGVLKAKTDTKFHMVLTFYFFLFYFSISFPWLSLPKAKKEG